MLLTDFSLDLAAEEELPALPAPEASPSGPPPSPKPAAAAPGAPPLASPHSSPVPADPPATATPPTPPTDGDDNSQGGGAEGGEEEEAGGALVGLGSDQPSSPPAIADRPPAAEDPAASMASMLASERAVVSSQPEAPPPTEGDALPAQQEEAAEPKPAEKLSASPPAAPPAQPARKRKGLFAGSKLATPAADAPKPAKPAKPAKPGAGGSETKVKAVTVKSVKPKKPLASAKPAPASAAAGPKAEGASAATAAEPVVKARSSYIIFQMDRRASIKEANPEMSSKELVSEIAKMWNNLTPDEKKPFVEKAAAEKAEKAKSMPAGGSAKPKKRKSQKEEGGAAGGAVKSGWSAFRKAHKARVQEDNPGATADVVDKVLKAEWQELDADEKADYGKINAKPEGDETKPPPAKKPKAASHKKKAAPVPAVDDDDDAELMDEEDEEDEEPIDWAATPAEAIMSESYNGKFQVKRSGMDLVGVADVDARAARGQHMTGTATPLTAVSPSMIADFDLFNKRFDTELSKRIRGSEIELDDLPAGSPLEAMRFLGDLRDDKGVLSGLPKGNKNDVMVKVPMLGLSRVVQRMLDVERRGLEDKYREKCNELSAALAKLPKNPPALMSEP